MDAALNSALVGHEQMASAAVQRQDYLLAKDILIKALKIAQAAKQLDPKLVDLIDKLAVSFCLERKYSEAESLYAHVLSTREKILGPSHPDVKDSIERLAFITRETRGNLAATTIAFRAWSLSNS